MFAFCFFALCFLLSCFGYNMDDNSINITMQIRDWSRFRDWAKLHYILCNLRVYLIQCSSEVAPKKISKLFLVYLGTI